VGLLKCFKSKILKPSEEQKEVDLMKRREECSEWLIRGKFLMVRSDEEEGGVL